MTTMIQLHKEDLIADFEKTFKLDTESTGAFEKAMSNSQWTLGLSAEGEFGTWTLISRNDDGFEFELTSEKVSASLTWEGMGDNWFFTSAFAFNSTPLGTFISTEPVSEDEIKELLKKDLEHLEALTKRTKAFLV